MRAAAWLLLFPLARAAYPNSSSPVTADPPVQPAGELCGVVEVLRDARLDSYGKIVHGLYKPPACAAAGMIRSVVLRVEGQVQGRQFDRFGALWVGGVEVLRTTTPEPTPAGIYWNLERDLADVASLFSESQNVSLAIPNVVSSIYTGVFRLNVSFELRVTTKAAADPPVVIPLLAASLLHSQPFQAMALSSGWMNLTLPNTLPPTERLLLDLFASGHGCEEFEAGFDCGGPLRRIRLLVDGRPAGLMYPFPVVYTGGIFPTLWRPLTGVDSFDIPPYRFELTPFLPLLMDGHQHILSITVDSEDSQGTWYLDPVILAVPGRHAVVGGDILEASLRGAGISLRNVSQSTVEAKDRAEIHVRSNLTLADGSVRTVEVVGRFDANASVTTHGSGGPTQPPPERQVEGISEGSIVISGLAQGVVKTTFRFPYSVYLNQSESGQATSVFADVHFQKLGSLMLDEDSSSWSHSIASTTTYQTDQNSSILLEENNASVRFSVLDSSGECYNKRLAASNGSVTDDSGGKFSCRGAGSSAGRVSSPALPLLSTSELVAIV